MDVLINKSEANGEYFPIPSKSITHRALICSFLASQESFLSNCNYKSQDILDTLAFGKALGREVSNESKLHILTKNNNYPSKIEFNIKESASTLRFVIPILYALGIEFTINCSSSLLKRPLDEYDKLFSKSDIIFFHDDKKVYGKGKLTASDYVINGDISSQYVSGLLFALPLLKGNSTLEVKNLESKDYVNLTLEVLKNYGIKIYYENDKYIIPGNQEYLATTYNIECDYTQTLSFVILGIINGNIKIDLNKLNLNSLQGDKKVFDMICDKFCMSLENKLIARKRAFSSSLEFDIKDTPDLGPILMILCLFTGGSIVNAERLAYKESNRITSMIEELNKIGALVNYSEGTISIKKYSLPFEKQKAIFDTHNDHRVCMALVILSTCLDGAIIKNYECVNKSYPNFFLDLEKLDCKIEMR